MRRRIRDENAADIGESSRGGGRTFKKRGIIDRGRRRAAVGKEELPVPRPAETPAAAVDGNPIAVQITSAAIVAISIADVIAKQIEKIVPLAVLIAINVNIGGA
jgi:hypothetical protein